MVKYHHRHQFEQFGSVKKKKKKTGLNHDQNLGQYRPNLEGILGNRVIEREICPETDRIYRSIDLDPTHTRN